MRLLVLGGHGQLGSDLAIAATDRHELDRPTHAELDVLDADALTETIGARRPDVVLNLAAFHKVEACEADPARAFEVNALGAWNAARAARAAGARYVFVSTDYVFDGEALGGYAEEASVSPVNAYGVAKAAGERMARIGCPDTLVVRGSGLFGHAGSSGKGGNFVETMLAKGASGDPVSVVDDQVFAPTCTRDMAERILALLEATAPPGVYHAANRGSCSWFAFAREIFRRAKLEVDLSPRPSGDQGLRRPPVSVLLDTRGPALGLPPMRPWQEALGWYLDERDAAPGASA